MGEIPAIPEEYCARSLARRRRRLYNRPGEDRNRIQFPSFWKSFSFLVHLVILITGGRSGADTIQPKEIGEYHESEGDTT